MAEQSKRYYWLKLKRDFFKRHDIQIIESMPNGKDYVLFYLKLLVESIDHEGELRFSDTIPYNEQMLSTITNTNVDIVHRAMEIFQSLNLVEVLDNQTIYMEETKKMVGSECWSAERVRRFRGNQAKALQCNTHVTSCNVEKEKEKEKEIDIESIENKAPEKPAHRSQSFKPPTIDDVRDYCKERKNHIDPDRFVDFYSAKGWMVGKNKMKDWKAAVRTWERGDQAGRTTDNQSNNGAPTGGNPPEVPKYGKIF